MAKIKTLRDRSRKDEAMFQVEMKILQRMIVHDSKIKEFMDTKENEKLEYKAEEAEKRSKMSWYILLGPVVRRTGCDMTMPYHYRHRHSFIHVDAALGCGVGAHALGDYKPHLSLHCGGYFGIKWLALPTILFQKN